MKSRTLEMVHGKREDKPEKPMSSHPEVDEELEKDGLHPSEAVIDSMTPEEKQKSKKKPVMSIHGRDIDEKAA